MCVWSGVIFWQDNEGSIIRDWQVHRLQNALLFTTLLHYFHSQMHGAYLWLIIMICTSHIIWTITAIIARTSEWVTIMWWSTVDQMGLTAEPFLFWFDFDVF